MPGSAADQDEVLDPVPDEVADGVEQSIERLLILERLGHDAQGPVVQRPVVRVLGRDDADRDVPGGDVVLEPLDHAPAVDVGQADVEGDGVGLVLAGHRQRGGAERRDQPLEALLARGLEQELGERQVVLDDQEQRIAGLDRLAVVAHLVDERGGLEDRRRCGVPPGRAPAWPSRRR